MKKKYKGHGKWNDNKDKSLKWEVNMTVLSWSLPVKDPRMGWGSVNPSNNQWEPIIVLERELLLNGNPVGITWTLVEEA